LFLKYIIWNIRINWIVYDRKIEHENCGKKEGRIEYEPEGIRDSRRLLKRWTY
jgi:hypothetical protein